LGASFVKNMQDSSGNHQHPIRIRYQPSLNPVTTTTIAAAAAAAATAATTTTTTTILNGFVVPRICFNGDNHLDLQFMQSEINEI
jgi:hypothetical protein